jgi:hypothetical protein
MAIKTESFAKEEGEIILSKLGTFLEENSAVLKGSPMYSEDGRTRVIIEVLKKIDVAEVLEPERIIE